MKRPLYILLAVCAASALAGWAAAWARTTYRQRQSKESQSAPVERPLPIAQEKTRLAKLKLAEFHKSKLQALDKSLWRGDRGFAVVRIAELATNESAQFLAEIWDNPLDVIDHERLRIIDLAGDNGCAACVPLVKKALSYHYPDERWHAARALTLLEGAKAVPLLTELAERDPDKNVREQTRRLISEVRRREQALPDENAIIRAVISWGRTLESGPYIKGNVAYFLRQGTAGSLEEETSRFYSKLDLNMLGKQWDANAVWVVKIGIHTAWAVLRRATDPPWDPVGFPYCGWFITLEQSDKSYDWVVRKAEVNERGPDEMMNEAIKANDGAHD